jgi:hypothetical protein
MVHAFQLLFVECNYPKAFVWWIGMHAVMFFFLFKEFYRQSYKARKVSIFTRIKKAFTKLQLHRFPSVGKSADSFREGSISVEWFSINE